MYYQKFDQIFDFEILLNKFINIVSDLQISDQLLIVQVKQWSNVYGHWKFGSYLGKYFSFDNKHGHVNSREITWTAGRRTIIKSSLWSLPA